MDLLLLDFNWAWTISEGPMRLAGWLEAPCRPGSAVRHINVLPIWYFNGRTLDERRRGRRWRVVVYFINRNLCSCWVLWTASQVVDEEAVHSGWWWQLFLNTVKIMGTWIKAASIWINSIVGGEEKTIWDFIYWTDIFLTIKIWSLTITAGNVLTECFIWRHWKERLCSSGHKRIAVVEDRFCGWGWNDLKVFMIFKKRWWFSLSSSGPWLEVGIIL